MAYAKIEDMVGKVFTKVATSDDMLIFENDVECYTFFHSQDCCEYVRIEDIVGDLSDLEGEPLVTASEETNLFDLLKNIDKEIKDDSHTWTFYKFATRKGYVDVRWLGESNGYYSESVDLAYRKVIDHSSAG